MDREEITAELPPEEFAKASRQIIARLEREEILFADWLKKQKGRTE